MSKRTRRVQAQCTYVKPIHAVALCATTLYQDFSYPWSTNRHRSTNKQDLAYPWAPPWVIYLLPISEVVAIKGEMMWKHNRQLNFR